MRHLTIKELAPYLAYKAQAILSEQGIFNLDREYPEPSDRNIGIITDFSIYKDGSYTGILTISKKISHDFSDGDIVLVLRPLSDLTKDEFKTKLKELKYRTDENGIEAIISDIRNNVAEYEIMLLCFENHIDCFDLINDKLAIDINKI